LLACADHGSEGLDYSRDFDRTELGPTLFCEAAILGCRCPLWVKSGHYAVSGRCPLYPQKRTSLITAGMSALCQKQTFKVERSRRRSSNVPRLNAVNSY